MRYLAFTTLILAAAPLAAQNRPYAQHGLGVWIEPHVGYTTFSKLYDGPVTITSAGGATGTGTLTIDPDDMVSYGLTLGFEPARSPFALFADAAYGRSEVDARACDAGGVVCDGGTSDLDALQVSLGVAARLTSPTSPYALRLHLGGNLTHLRVDDGVERFGYDNPGFLAGLSLEVPLWETVGVKLSGMNSFIRTDIRSLERDLAEPGETASLEDKWANVFRFGVGIRIGY